MFAWPSRAGESARTQRLAALAGLVAGVGALVAVGPSLLAGLSSAAEYLAGGSATSTPQSGGALAYSQAWLSTIPESRPLAAWPGLFVDGPRLLTWPVMVALPLAMLLWLRAALKGHAAEAILAAVTGAHVMLSLSQQRYTYYLAAPAGIAVCCVVRALVDATGRRRLMLAGPVLAAALLLSAIPQWRQLPSTVQAPSGDAAMFLLNVRDRVTPPPLDADGRAEWGVMCPWALGHTLRQWTKLPVAADNFGYGFEDQARTYLARSDEEALAILARRHCRYVLTTQFESMLKGHATALGLPPPDAQSFGLRLHRGAVSAELFRPIVDSASGDLVDGVFVPRLRLFEVVAGP